MLVLIINCVYLFLPAYRLECKKHKFSKLSAFNWVLRSLYVSPAVLKALGGTIHAILRFNGFHHVCALVSHYCNVIKIFFF